MKIWKYIKAAFTNHWNLLGLAGGVGFSLVTGQPEIGLPLVAAAELAWLGFVGTHPRFRKFVDLRERSKSDASGAEAAEARMKRMLNSLPRGAQQRFDKLMDQCEELRCITSQYQRAHGKDLSSEAIADVRLDGLDRLMWLFLKLLFTESSLNRFFETTSIDDITKEIKQVSQRLEREEDRPENAQRHRIIATLKDNLQTCELRKQNFERARDSFELVKAEQRRLENKIRSLAEMGISQGDPATLSSQVDTVAGSVHETEKTLSELEFVTGLSNSEDEVVPEIVTRTAVSTH